MAEPAIGDHAIIGDCRTAALVCRDGGLDWLCLPHFSGPAVFAALLDRERGGTFHLRPAEGVRAVRRRYVSDTPVLETEFITPTGRLRLTDMMTVLGETPGELEPAAEILRIAEALDGEVELDALYQPRPDFARGPVKLRDCAGLGWSLSDGGWLLFLNSDMPLVHDKPGACLRGRQRLRAGERRVFSLGFVDNDIGVFLPLDEADRRCRRTVAWWQAWSARCRYDGPHADLVRRSVLTLKLLSYSLSGAVVAAATTSLPESIGGSRNWDYRYCWLRDASLTLEAFLDLGYREEGAAFLEWLLHSTRLTWPELQVLYDVHGESRVPEEELTHFSGYRGSRPVRIGNGAWSQLQLDAYGQVVVAAAAYASRGGTLDWGERRLLRGLGETVCRLWRKPDAGIWEVRGEPRHYTHSKVMCWAALNCLLRLDQNGAISIPRDRFAATREEIRQWIDQHCVDAGHGFIAAAGLPMADASLLLLPRYRYVDAADPRWRRSVATIERDLGRGRGLILRYGNGYDGLPDEEHPFGICSFWNVEALARQGRIDEAARTLDQLAGFANDVGLYAEEIDAESGAALGNFPQAFSHVGLIHATLALHQLGGSRR